jgi:hypothetical protein
VAPETAFHVIIELLVVMPDTDKPVGAIQVFEHADVVKFVGEE